MVLDWERKRNSNGNIGLCISGTPPRERALIESALHHPDKIKIEITKLNKMVRYSEPETKRSKNGDIELYFDLSGTPSKERALIESVLFDPDTQLDIKIGEDRSSMKIILT